MKILGISAYYHDSAAAIIVDGQVMAAAQEERFSRIKNDASFPSDAIQFCLQLTALKLSDLDAIAYYEKPFLKFERLLETYHSVAPKGLPSFLRAMPIWIKEKLFLKNTLKKELQKLSANKTTLPKLFFPEHHLSHAASAYFPTTYRDALILTIDGVGEYTTTLLAHAQGNTIKPLRSISFPHSLGLLYAAATYYLGFKINSGEYKVMGLAAYGDQHSDQFKKFHHQIKTHLVQIKPDGSFWLNQSYFKYMSGLKMCNDPKWEKLFGFPRLAAGTSLEQQHQNFALAFQKVTEEIVLQLVKTGKEISGSENLCLAGGVALNCVANGQIIQQGLMKNIHVQPASGDAGGAIGAALAIYYLQKPKVQRPVQKQPAYLGPSPGYFQVPNDQSIPQNEYTDFAELCERIAEVLAKGQTVAWVQDRMEFGPRALGNRSILANPMLPNMMEHINVLIKNRETFRPFAPVVLEEDADKYFELFGQTSPHMLFTFPVKSKMLPAITHVDNSARVQTVNATQNAKLYQLLLAFKKITGHGVLLNTSFNTKDQPIVRSAKEAYESFLEMSLDHLVIGNKLYSRDL